MVQRQPYSSIFIIGYFSKSIFFFICTHCILFAYKGDCLKWEFDCKRGGTSVDALCLVCCKRLKSRLAISGSMKIKHVNKTRFKICKFSHYLKICLNSSRYVTNSRKYTTIKKKKHVSTGSFTGSFTLNMLPISKDEKTKLISMLLP